MRISSDYIGQLFVAEQNAQETAIATTQQQISTGHSFSTPADNPVAATEVLGLNASLSATTQYGANANLAQGRLSVEDSTLSTFISTLQSIRSLGLEAANATNDAATRTTIANQIQADGQTLLQLANTQDGTGQYIFSGTATATTPFSQSGGTFTYGGTQGQRLVEIGPNTQISDGDSGALVFQQIKNGNGTFVVGANAGNSGSAVIGANSVTSPTQWNAGSPPYTITFSSPSAYTVTNSSGNPVSSGTYTDGGTIAFAGAQLTLSGTPAAGDIFSVATSSNQDVFSTVQNLVSALTSSGSGGQAPTVNAINRAIEAIDQAQGNISATQASVGTRLQSIDTAASANSTLTLQLQSQVSSLQDLNYAAAATTLNQQMTALQAAQESFARIQGLSLFNYIQ